MRVALWVATLALGIFILGACVTVQPLTQPSTQGVPADTAPPSKAPSDTAPGTASGGTPSDDLPTATSVITASITPSSTLPAVTPQPPSITETPVPTEPPPQEPTSTPTQTPLPTSTATVTPTEGAPPTATPYPDAVFVRDHRSFMRGSDLLVVGEVTNGSAIPVYNVTVSAAFYDASGNLIGAAEAPAYLAQTLPTQSNPFKVRLPNAPADVSTYELALRWDELTPLGYDRITIVSDEIEPDNGVTVRGELRNDGFSQVSEIVVAASFYDAAGQVLDTYQGTVTDSTLAPGEMTAYSIQTRLTEANFDHYLVQTQGVLGR